MAKVSISEFKVGNFGNLKRPEKVEFFLSQQASEPQNFRFNI